MIIRAQELLKEYQRMVGANWTPPPKLDADIQSFVSAAQTGDLADKTRRKELLIEIINTKFRFNQKGIKGLIDSCAKFKVYFSPIEKNTISTCYDSSNAPKLKKLLLEKGLDSDVAKLHPFVKPSETLKLLKAELENSTIKRSDARTDVQEERTENIHRSLFSSWIYRIVDRNKSRSYFIGSDKYRSMSYMEMLRIRKPSILDRGCGLFALRIPSTWWEDSSYSQIRDRACEAIHDAYSTLSNHSILSIYIENTEHASSLWELVFDITIYAERLFEENLKRGFFKPEEIEKATSTYIPNIDKESSNFNAYQSGFAYRDCIAFSDSSVNRKGSASELHSAILLFEKHVVDETKVPCPACWSEDVRGNSYPILGVKSWECHNSICPERSAFNRGNRFSAMGILRNAALYDERALIDDETINKWRLDVLDCRKADEILSDIVKLYSLPDDTIKCINYDLDLSEIYGRRIDSQKSKGDKGKSRIDYKAFLSGSFFNRYLSVRPEDSRKNNYRQIRDTPEWLSLYQGNCISVLEDLPPSSVDGAVTSPPYYNAKEYSQWNNLYCYLYDMKRSAMGVFRTLKPGAYYLFNIFDYFDNDNIVAFSSLGKRRLTLSSYLGQIFREVGFTINGNIVWFKGHIEGSRNYNQGNRAPYFQRPLNAWEHIIILRKPGNDVPEQKFPEIIHEKPVFKWVKGENRHGHTAPFPEFLPDLLCSRLKPGSTILDPFAGSLTTAIAAASRQQNAIAIELHEEYCELGLRRIATNSAQLTL